MEVECNQGHRFEVVPTYDPESKTFLIPFCLTPKLRKVAHIIHWIWGSAAMSAVAFALVASVSPTLNSLLNQNRLWGLLSFFSAMVISAIGTYQWIEVQQHLPTGVGFCFLTPEEVIDLRWGQNSDGSWRVWVKLHTGYQLKLNYLQDIDAFVIAKQLALIDK